MKQAILPLLYLFFSINTHGQGGTVIIEGQILGYDRAKTIEYSLSESYELGTFTRIKPDTQGKFIIKREIPKTSFFSLIYLQDNTYHSCKLIVEPGNYYSFISSGRNRNDLKHHTPDIYSLYTIENNAYLKRDLGQMYYNLIDNNTMGFIYRSDWDLINPDSLIPTLKKRINSQLSLFRELLATGEINQRFYDIAKLNVEYTQAYRLATTIYSTWISERYSIDDSIVRNKLIAIYPEIFAMYPVNKEVNLQFYNGFDKYVDLYLTYLSDCEDGKFIPRKKKGDAATEPLMNSDGHLNEQAHSTYRLLKSMNNMASYGLNAGAYGREVLEQNPDMDMEIRNLYDRLLAKVDEFDKLAEIDFPEGIIILDEQKPITSFDQLQEVLANKPALVDIWGTWCIPCRLQFQYQNRLKTFLQRYEIQIVYIAYEYGNSRQKWENIVKGYKLEGFHFIANEMFTSDFEKYAGKIIKFPTYLIIDKNGNIVESDAYFPSQADELINQLKQELKL